MFALESSWWELPLRTAIIFGALLVMVRLSGRRTVGQFTPFDLLVVMLLSESVSAAMSGGDDSVSGGLMAAATLITLNVLIAFITSRSQRMQKLVEGDPVLVGRGGQIFADVLKAHRIPVCDVERALREADCNQADMKFAFLEPDGEISILKDSGTSV